MQATFVMDLSGFNGEAKLYRVAPPVTFGDDKTTDHVVTSKVNGGWAHETYLFPADADGNVVDWCELEGSARGEHSHEEVLAYAGYEVN